MYRGQINSSFNRNSPDVSPSLLPSSSQILRPSTSQDFIPFENSSPISSAKSSRSASKPYRRGVMRVHDRSFSSPPSNTLSTAFSPNTSYGSAGYSTSYRPRQFQRSNNYYRKRNYNFGGNPNDCQYNSNLYFHSSMVEDPWAALEKKLVEWVGVENMQVEVKKFGSGDSCMVDSRTHFIHGDKSKVSSMAQNSFNKSDESNVSSTSTVETEIQDLSSTNTVLSSSDET